MTTDSTPTHFTAIEQETEFNAASPTFTPTGRYRLVWNTGTRTAWMPEDMAVEMFEGTATPDDEDPQIEDEDGWVVTVGGEVVELFATRTQANDLAEWLVSQGGALVAHVTRYDVLGNYPADDEGC